VYDDPDFQVCKPFLKKYLRKRGYCVYEIETADMLYPSQDDEWLEVDWSNTWTATWRDFKDRSGLFGLRHRL
jgi:hypothetical protein